MGNLGSFTPETRIKELGRGVQCVVDPRVVVPVPALRAACRQRSGPALRPPALRLQTRKPVETEVEGARCPRTGQETPDGASGFRVSPTPPASRPAAPGRSDRGAGGAHGRASGWGGDRGWAHPRTSSCPTR